MPERPRCRCTRLPRKPYRYPLGHRQNSMHGEGISRQDEESWSTGEWEHKRGEMKLGKQRQLLLTLILAAAPSHASPIVRAMSMPLQRLGRLYGSALSKNPVLTHCFQGAAISGIGLAAGSPRGVRERGVVLMCVFCLCR